MTPDAIKGVDLVSVKLIAVDLAECASLAYWIGSAGNGGEEYHETEMRRHYERLKLYFEPETETP